MSETYSTVQIRELLYRAKQLELSLKASESESKKQEEDLILKKKENGL